MTKPYQKHYSLRKDRDGYVSIELPHEAWEVAVLKILRQDVLGEIRHIPNNKAIVIITPRDHRVGRWIIHHIVGLTQKWRHRHRILICRRQCWVHCWCYTMISVHRKITNRILSTDIAIDRLVQKKKNNNKTNITCQREFFQKIPILWLKKKKGWERFRRYRKRERTHQFRGKKQIPAKFTTVDD